MRFQKISPYVAVMFILALLMSACQVLNMENGSASGASQAGLSELQLGQTRFFGNVASIASDRIKVDEVVFRVDSNSHIPKTLNVGDAVAVNALLLPDQSRYAVSLISANDQVGALDKTKLAFKLYGKVDGIGGQSWVVSNEIIQTHPETVIDKGIALTSLVKVEGSLMDGKLVADSIQLDSQLPGYPVETATPEPSGTATPTSEMTTTVETTSTVEATETVEPTSVVVSGNEVEFHGTLESNMGDSWMISGKMVLIVPQTEIKGNLVVGDFVKVEAWQQPDGSFIAHEIEKEDPSESNSEDHDGEVSGIITEISEGSFMVAGVLVLTNSFTEIMSDLQVGDYVEVEGLLQADGSILAREVDVHDESISNGSDDDSQDDQDDDSYNGGNDDSDDDSHDGYDDDTDHDSGGDHNSWDNSYGDVYRKN